MAYLIRTLCRLPLLVAVLATALALGLGTPSPAAAGLGPAMVDTTDMPGVGETAPDTDADISPDEPQADPIAATDAVPCEAPAPSRPRPAIARTDPEFPSRLASLLRPPSPARPAMRGGRSG